MRPAVFGIAEPAEGCCLKLDGANFTGDLELLRVLFRQPSILPRAKNKLPLM